MQPLPQTNNNTHPPLGRVISQENFLDLQMLVFPAIHEVLMTFVMFSVLSQGIQPRFEILPLLTINVAHYMWLLINHSTQCVLQRTFLACSLQDMKGYMGNCPDSGSISANLTDTIMMILVRKYEMIFVIMPFLQFRHRFKKTCRMGSLRSPRMFYQSHATSEGEELLLCCFISDLSQ